MAHLTQMLPGDKHGFLTYIEPAPSRWGTRHRSGLFRCDCGADVVQPLGLVARGRVKSCGCQQQTTRAYTPPPSGRPRGTTRTPLYKCWTGMVNRSTAGSATQLGKPTYVGVGRDPRWDSFETFAEDMGPTYFPGAVLGRYGDQGDYTPTNCRWITKSQNGAEAAAHSSPDHPR